MRHRLKLFFTEIIVLWFSLTIELAKGTEAGGSRNNEDWCRDDPSFGCNGNVDSDSCSPIYNDECPVSCEVCGSTVVSNEVLMNSCFEYGEDIIIKFNDTSPEDHDWIAIFDSWPEDVSQMTVSSMIDWSWLCGSQSEMCKVLYGSIIFTSSFNPGEYKAFMLDYAKYGGPYNILAESVVFTIKKPEESCSEPSQPTSEPSAVSPTNPPQPYPTRSPHSDPAPTPSPKNTPTPTPYPNPDPTAYLKNTPTPTYPDSEPTAHPKNTPTPTIFPNDGPYPTPYPHALVCGDDEVDEIHTNKNCYVRGEEIEVSFSQCNPLYDDWLGVYYSDAKDSDLGQDFKLWVWACGDQGCQGATSFGSVTFDYDYNDPSGTTSWPLDISPPVGYQVHLIRRNNGGPYASYAASTIFYVVDTQDDCSSYSVAP